MAQHEFLERVAKKARRSSDPRRTILRLVLGAHGWRQPWCGSAAWYPPVSTITFGEPVTVASLRRRGYRTEADHLMSVENTLMNWAAGVCGAMTWKRCEDA